MSGKGRGDFLTWGMYLSGFKFKQREYLCAEVKDQIKDDKGKFYSVQM